MRQFYIETGDAARHVSASNPEWLAEYHRVLPDFRASDVIGSCFAVRDYHVHTDFGGDTALARLCERLRQRGLRLILDFVPNHVARFLENHDEPRAATTFAPEDRRAAAVITFLTPELRFFHQGQREGKRV